MVLVLGPVPGAPTDVPMARVAHEMIGRPLPAKVSVQQFRREHQALFDSFARLSKKKQATVVDVLPWFCNAGRCNYILTGESLYRDKHHLSVQGAMHFVGKLQETIAGASTSHALLTHKRNQ